ncbi:MAG: 2'-5' RNA ligase family protein [Anaerolineales bacterium]|jgi:2'-5' RNA ligase
MHGLVSLLSQPHYQKVQQIWDELEQECGLEGIRVTPYPHFSWQIAADYDMHKLRQVMENIAANTTPFNVFTTGLGIFTGSKPVIFVPLVKSTQLMNFHDLVWESVKSLGRDISPYYDPSSWIPHISLAYEDVDESNISAVINKLVFETYNWEISVDNISLIYEPEGEIGKLKYNFHFIG